MTYPQQQPPVMRGPGLNPHEHGAWVRRPVPPPKRRRILPWIIGIFGVVLVLFVGLAALGAILENDEPTSAASPSSPPAAKKPAGPAAADFKLTAKITEQTCYGEAGCAVTWLPVVTYTGPAIPAGQTYVITYQVSGAESGTKVGKIVMGSSGPAKQNEKRNRTAAEDTKITLKVTGVERS